MMGKIKKILFMLFILSILTWFGVNFYRDTPRNIFDEMYLEVKKTYQTNNILGRIEDFEINLTWDNRNEYFQETPSGYYQQTALTEDFHTIRIGFYFKKTAQSNSISFERWLDSGERLSIWSHYYFREKKLIRTIKIATPNSVSADYIEEEELVKSYLQENGITAFDLNRYYDEVVNQKVLKDWLSIYDSQYSPTDYGELTIETQWEGW